MATLHPPDTCRTECIGQSRFQLNRFPTMHRIEVVNEVRKQPNPKSFDSPARLVAGLVLIEAQVRITNGLPHIQPERIEPGGSVQQDNVNAVARSWLPSRGCLEFSSGEGGSLHPVRRTHPEGVTRAERGRECLRFNGSVREFTNGETYFSKVNGSSELHSGDVTQA